MTSWHEFHQYALENGGMDDPDEVCHCGLPIEDHRLGGAAETEACAKIADQVFDASTDDGGMGAARGIAELIRERARP